MKYLSLAAELSWTPTMPAIQLLRSLPIKLLFLRQNGKFFRFSKIYWHSWIEFGLPASKISDINGCLKVVVPPLVVCRFFYRKKIHWNSWHVLSHFLQIFLFRAFLFFSRKSLSYSFFKQKKFASLCSHFFIINYNININARSSLHKCLDGSIIIIFFH